MTDRTTGTTDRTAGIELRLDFTPALRAVAHRIGSAFGMDYSTLTDVERESLDDLAYDVWNILHGGFAGSLRAQHLVWSGLDEETKRGYLKLAMDEVFGVVGSSEEEDGSDD